MNGDTIDRIARFLERDESKLPDKVSNSMILIALREERDARKREFGKVLEKVDELVTILKGREGYPTEGLLHQMVQFARFRDVVVWVVSAVLLAFLGGLGMYLFNLIAQ